MIDEKKVYILYFINLITSSLIYSFITLKLISFQTPNTLIVIELSGVASIIILLDVKKFNILGNISLRKCSFIAVVLSIITFLLINVIQNSILYLSFYFIMELLILEMSLKFQTNILNNEISFSMGFLNMQILRTASTLTGFLIGSILGAFNSNNLFIYLFILLNLYTFFSSKNVVIDQRKIKKEINFLSLNKIRGKIYYLIIGVLSTAITLWIPLIIKTYNEIGMSKLSWLPFVLPGIVSWGFMTLQKKIEQLYYSNIIEYIYIPLLVIFFIIRQSNLFPIFQAVLFSLITAISLSLSVRNRKIFLEMNLGNNMKYILQSLAVSSNIISIFFALFGKNSYIVELFLMLSCCLSVLYMIIRREKV